MKIALTGAKGQLGTDLHSQLGDGIVALGHDDIELGSDESVDRVLSDLQPDMVINCAAYNLVDQAEDEPAAAYEFNALGPRRLARFCGPRDITLVHFSSDYVFGLDADRREPYCETDAPGPQGAYAASKLQGEYFVQSLCPRHFVIRTCGLYGIAALQGAGKGNFIETMLRLGADRDTLTVVDDQYCTPTSTFDLAEATAALIQTDAFGLYHATNTGTTTWCGLAREVFRQAGLTVDVQPITSEQFGAKAPRPPYSVLSTAKLAGIIGGPLPVWTVAVTLYLKSRKPQ